MAYGFNDYKSKVEMYSKSQIDTKVSDDTEVDVLYFKLENDVQLPADVKLTATKLSLYLLSSEYSTPQRRKFRCSDYTFAVSEIKLVDNDRPSHPVAVSGVFISSFNFVETSSQPILEMTANTSNAILSTSVKISASVSYVKVLAIPNSRITDPRT